MGKSRDHRLEVYDQWLHLAVTHEQWTKLNRRFDQDDRRLGLGGTRRVIDTEPLAGDSGSHYLIWIDRADHQGNSKSILVNTIAHEASHVAGLIFEHIGETPTNDSETRAYLVGWISQWIWERL